MKHSDDFVFFVPIIILVLGGASWLPTSIVWSNGLEHSRLAEENQRETRIYRALRHAGCINITPTPEARR